MKKSNLRKCVIMFLLCFIVFGGIFITSKNIIYAKADTKPTVTRSIYEGDEITLKIKNPKKKVKWTSSNAGVAYVKSTSGARRQNAVICGQTKGKAVITAQIGNKKQKALVKVKHRHDYSIPATCTTPMMCECGKTIGTALGHQWSEADCVTPAKCTRPDCGAIGDVDTSKHIFGDDGLCQRNGCDEINVPGFISIWLMNAGTVVENGSYDYIDVGWILWDYVEYDFNIYTGSANSTFTIGTYRPNGTGEGLMVDFVEFIKLTNYTGEGTAFVDRWNNVSNTIIPVDATLEFQIEFKIESKDIDNLYVVLVDKDGIVDWKRIK